MTRKSLSPAFRRQKRDNGQGMTEYIIIVALIAIAAIGVVTVFGQNIRAIFGASTASLAGDVSATAKTFNGNTVDYVGKKGLSKFGTKNDGK
jgi:pilus assembly protein Flp/PilA